ncbi:MULTISPECIES: hypothetical protein [Bacillus]|uniref:hypothetical protein n=1 Tax=Bacillus TaxID=1386 RepID=UPI000397DF84|nr:MULTISPECIES: hypothetical protein [Bacillus]AIU82855.1 hypothetical protein NG74_02808 [Bacillus velezensis]ATD74053.1 hypothetical protein CLI98_00721 [Bacillus velezensis]ERH56158.1 hypothetical protein O205_07890 [Bacillus amyloliquefaciens EGD-AQ14]MDH3093779.1 hypothetical protein [Bacillus velezensis]QUS16008.1 hypothetical protein KEM64_04435 [Bacillus velezensis]
MNDIINESKDILEKALKHIEDYLQIKNDILDNDFVQLLGDSSKVIGHDLEIKL